MNVMHVRTLKISSNKSNQAQHRVDKSTQQQGTKEQVLALWEERCHRQSGGATINK